MYEGSITDAALVKKVFKKHNPEYVFHFAAVPRVSYSVEHPQETTEVNVLGTVHLLDAAREYGVRRFIYSSSSSLYGGAKVLPTREHENGAQPKSPYAIQKYVGEHLCRVYSELHGLDTVSLRYFNVYGPNQFGDSPYSTVISAWLEALYFPNTKKAFLEGNGLKSRDFCFVDNVVSANLKAMESKKPLRGLACNIAHGERTTIKEVKKLLEELTGRSLQLEKRPDRVGDVSHTHADISLARKRLGYKPLVGFTDGLRRTVEWYESRKA
jgi:UDP-glucose 4-epimerase